MKKILSTLLIVMTVLVASAQDKNMEAETKPATAPAVYISTSTGVNNNTGIFGFSFDVPVSSHVVIDAGPGASTWNYKAYAGVKYYMRPHQRGFAFGTGLTYCSGLRDDKHDLQTIYGYTEPVEYNKNPQTNILFAAYRYWTMGKKYNRFYLELGWSVSLTGGNSITQLTGDPITTHANNDLSSWTPGGLILAAGFSFGVH
jgi:hypothetical protein